MVRGTVDKAITLTNPRLKLLPNCYKRLTPAVENTIEFLRAQVSMLPAVHPLSAKAWSSDPVLRAFFSAPSDIPAVLARSDNLHTLFDKFPGLDEACLVLGMAFSQQRVFGMALHGEMVQRDVAQTSVSFSDHTSNEAETKALLALVAEQSVGNRPGRIEPRAVIRRPKPYPLLTQARAVARENVRKHGHPKKLKYVPFRSETAVR